jgi:streptogramin lyase
VIIIVINIRSKVRRLSGGESMKNFKKLSTISCLLDILTVLTIMQSYSVSTVNTTQLSYKTFPVQPYTFSSPLITNGSIKYVSLPSDSLPMGILYDLHKNVVWVALYWNRSLAMINVTTMTATIYPMPWQIDDYYFGPLPWTLTITPDNNIWFSIRSYMNTPNHPPSSIPYLGKLDATSNIIYVYYIPLEIGSGSDIKFYNDFVWYLTTNGLSKINYTTGELDESYIRDFSGGFVKPDADCLWISSVSGNFVTRFNMTSKNFDINLTGFDRPMGIEVDSDFVYVAENSRSIGSMGTIAKINKTDFTVSRINTALITNEGPYHVLKDSYGHLWFTDNSNHLGIAGGMVYDSISPYCYFMTEVPGNSIWFSAVGSAYIGMKHSDTLGKTDVNFDGKVDGKDIAYVAMWFGNVVPPAPEKCDMDNDAKVDGKDIAMVAINFGKVL